MSVNRYIVYCVHKLLLLHPNKAIYPPGEHSLPCCPLSNASEAATCATNDRDSIRKRDRQRDGHRMDKSQHRFMLPTVGSSPRNF